MAVDRPVERVVGLAEHAVAEPFPGPGDPGHLGEREQQVELGAGEPEIGTLAADLARGLVDVEVEVRGVSRAPRPVAPAAAATGARRRSTAPTRATSSRGSKGLVT